MVAISQAADCVESSSLPGASLPNGRACWMKNGPLVPEWATPRGPTGTIVVTPWNVCDGVPAGPSMLAEGRDVSSSGLSFAHAGLLACRFAAVSFRADREDGSIVETILVRLLWCRFTGQGGYLSGGRFERMLGDEFDDGTTRELLAGR
ncbi:MAG: hypothetical protein WBC44_08520 [Planctomycetaceae bacterium]